MRPVRGSWVAQSVECLTWAQAMMVVRAFELHIGLVVVSTEPTLDPLSLSLCPSPACALYLTLSQSEHQLLCHIAGFSQEAEDGTGREANLSHT